MIRKAVLEDIPAIARLSSLKRQHYQKYQPIFHKEAADALEKQTLFLEDSLTKGNVIVLVHQEKGSEVDGFIIGSLVNAPPVYNPGGKICYVDDFMVENPTRWTTVGQPLMEKVIEMGREKGAVLANIVCGPMDGPKRELLNQSGFSVATEWHIKSLILGRT